jgi:hypothetical protein
MEAQVPLLVVQEGQPLGHEWRLDRDMMTLGRGEECDMVVSERQVSRVCQRAPGGAWHAGSPARWR